MGCESFWTSKNKKEQGNKGEDLASTLLMGQGFTILIKNWRTPYGEVDLVAFKNQSLYIFEIKTRKSDRQQFRLITFQQQRRLQRAALWIWQNKRSEFKYFKCRVLLVTRSNIEIKNLPLLYDTT